MAVAALDTVGKIIDYARILLQDTIEPFRYPTDQLIQILNFSVMDARRIRPDLFLEVQPSPANPTVIPYYTDVTDPVTIDQQYRLALVYFVVGQANLRDEEETQDARAAAMMLKFAQMLSSPVIPG